MNQPQHHHDDHGHDHPHPHGTVSPLIVELREHIPFSVSAVAIGLVVTGAICIIGLADAGVVEAGHSVGDGHDHGRSADDPARLFFHLFHPAHMLFSAAATSAMFARYERKVIKAIIIGLIGAIGICGISDIIFPHLSLLILNTPTPLHICIWEHPGVALPFALIGVIVGVAASGGSARTTIVSHSLHVLASTMASIFYMVGPLGVTAWIDMVGKLFVFITIAVVLPCCLSDIVFPMLMSRGGRTTYDHEGGHTH